jgi:2-dehydro-3-deoxyphosphooctonate aldolase (KDO 8-P synthase)
MMKRVKVGSFSIANDLPLALMAGPCVLESRQHAHDMMGKLVEMTSEFGIPFIYKTSFDKANRTSIKSSRGLGLDEALDIFDELKKSHHVPIMTDVHLPDQCAEVAKVVDVLQIPAFLCRQTDLLLAAAGTGKAINVKKGQFLAPWDMQQVITKIADSGNQNVMVCERGSSFGYNTLVTDMRSLPIMEEFGYPVVFDATHSVQQPGGQGTSSGGERRFAPVLARAAVAVGVAAVFIETHQDPDKAPSDGPNMIPLHEMPYLIETLLKIDMISKEMKTGRKDTMSKAI